MGNDYSWAGNLTWSNSTASTRGPPGTQEERIGKSHPDTQLLFFYLIPRNDKHHKRELTDPGKNNYRKLQSQSEQQLQNGLVRLLVTGTCRRWHKKASEGGALRRAGRLGFHSQMVPLSPDLNALALLTDANAKVGQLGTCLFLGMGVTHSILPICLWFYMQAVISRHSCVWDRWEDKDKHRQLLCSSLWQARLKSPAQWLTPIMGRRERRKHLALKAIREVPFLHNQFPLLAEPSQNAFSENKGENPTFSNPESWPIPAQMRKPKILYSFTVWKWYKPRNQESTYKAKNVSKYTTPLKIE